MNAPRKRPFYGPTEGAGEFIRRVKAMNVFWFAKSGNRPGIYAIGLGSTEIAVITAPDDALAAQWAQCCARALNERERQLIKLAEEQDAE